MKNKYKLLLIILLVGVLNVNAAILKLETTDGMKIGYNKEIKVDVIVADDIPSGVDEVTFDLNYSQESRVVLDYKETNIIDNFSRSGKTITLKGRTNLRKGDKILEIKIRNTQKDTKELRSNLRLRDITLPEDNKKYQSNALEIWLQEEKKKSDNATLSGLILSSGSLTPKFNKDVNDYKVFNVKDTINAITIGKKCDNCDIELKCTSGCSLSGSSRVNLALGKNEVTVTSISESRKNKLDYKLTIYRGDTKDNSPFLENLEVDGFSFEEMFTRNKLDYEVRVPNDLTDANIIAVPEDPNATVEIKGNNDLIVGENVITITVKSSETEDIKIYNITLIRLEEDEVMPSTTVILEEEPKKSKTKLVIIVIVILLALTGAYFAFFHKKVMEKLEEKKRAKEDLELTKEIEQEEDELILETKELSIEEALEDIEKSKELSTTLEQNFNDED